MSVLTVHRAGPGLTVQDLGRPGWKAQGLSTGGAADRLAVLEAAALLSADPGFAVIEMMGFGGTFSVDAPTRFALTGAQMSANIAGVPVSHNTTHTLPSGAKLTVGGATAGVFGYLAFAGGILTPQIMGSRATHLTAGIGGRLQDGDRLPLGIATAGVAADCQITSDDRFAGGTIRVMPGPQTDFFASATTDRFLHTTFRRSPRGNRQGIRLDHQGEGFGIAAGRAIVSDLVVPGDIQIAGDGTPYILLAECQTIGGYPRIGSVIPADLPKIAQAAPGTPLNFRLLSVAEADATFASEAAVLRGLRARCMPLTRDPHDISDLLGYQLISGATRGDDMERP